MSWFWDKNEKRSEIIAGKILSRRFRDYLVCDEGEPIQSSRLTDEFAHFCRNKYQELIERQLKDNHGLYVKFDCMLPPCHKTYDERHGKLLRWECTNQFNTGDSIDVAFIKHPTTEDIYLPLRPIFAVIQDIMASLGKPYIVSFERLVFNIRYWEEENAVLGFYVVQQSYGV